MTYRDPQSCTDSGKLNTVPNKDQIMNMRIRPSSVSGRTQAPPSKSYTHRAILAAGLSKHVTISDALDSADTRASRRAATSFGAAISNSGNEIVVDGANGSPQVSPNVVDCANSGTTMRLASGIAGLVDGITILTGDASLRSRPQGPLLDALTQLGVRAESATGDDTAPLVLRGPIEGDSVTIPGDVSSQYVSALLMAGGLTEDGIDISLSTPLKSAPYVDITTEVLDDFGIETEKTSNGFLVEGGQSYEREEPYAVPGDFSSISYPAAAGAVAGDPGVTIGGARPSSQGDTAIIDILERMGATVSWDQDAGMLTVEKAPLQGVTVDVSDTPDLLPTVAALGTIADGSTRITNCEHVRYKETDRVRAMANELTALGAVVDESQDELVVHGGDSQLRGTTVDGYDDHRIIMALSITGLVAAGETIIRGVEHVDVSYPNFFDAMTNLGVDATDVKK